MYPHEPTITVDPGPAGRVLEGAFRPGFFTGVLTVVLKLFNLVRPDLAVFGEKDAQQVFLVRRMVAELNLGVDIVAVPTVREPDGLAASSRNGYLSAADRVTALSLSRALLAGSAAGKQPPCGRVGGSVHVGAACGELGEQGGEGLGDGAGRVTEAQQDLAVVVVTMSSMVRRVSRLTGWA